MSKIRILHDHTINKIAAGEVIENPASVVKELVENSLDAGAKEISVEIKAGGRQLIRVSDNGIGMSADDALLCLERHATSKIKEVEDIQDLLTMGFRGEAMPSIAAISKFTLLTSTHEAKDCDGTLVMVDGGQIISCGPAARSPGTTIEVKSLFFNVPVRKKFQKSPTYDAQEILKMISVIALGNPSIKFELISDQKQVLKTDQPANSSTFQEKFADRIQAVLGTEFFSAIKHLSFSREPYQLEGFIGDPSYTRHNRSGQYLFINQRPVHSPFIAFAIRDGYGTSLATNRHPVFVLHLTMPGSLIDVNVHPQKKEIRLRQEYLLKEYLMQAVQQTLQQNHFDSFTSENQVTNFTPFCSEPFTSNYTLQTETPQKKECTPYPELKSYLDFKTHYSSLPLPLPTTKHDTQLDLLSSIPAKKTSPRIITTHVGFIQIDPLTFNMPDGLCLIDQKAASLRIHYERLLNKQTGSNTIQPLLIPITLDFSSFEAALLKEQLPYFNQMGFSIQEFGHATFIVDAIPDLLKKEDIRTCLIGISQDLNDCGDSGHIEREKSKRMALAASRLTESCTKRLSFDEAQALVNQLTQCETPLHCPFGKPTFIHLTYEKLNQLKG